MMRTLRDMNMSKFVAEDVPLFLSLIDDLFPGQNADRASFPDVSAALTKASAPLSASVAAIIGADGWDFGKGRDLGDSHEVHC